MNKIFLNFNGVTNAKQAHQLIAEKMQFPDYYGANFDALADCLAEINQQTIIAIFNYKSKNKELNDFFSTLIEVLKDAEIDNPQIAIVFSILEDNI